MLIRFTEQPPWTVAELLVHRLDEVNAGAVQAAFAPMLHHPHGGIVVELSRLDFVDQAGLAALQALLQRLSADSLLHLAGHCQLLLRLRELNRLPPNVDIFPTLNDALH